MMLAQPASSSLASNDQLNSIPNATIRKLNLPQRSVNAIGGDEFVKQVIGLSLADREKAVAQEILSGNVPSFSLQLEPVQVTEVVDGKRYECLFYVAQDYMAIGSEEDYLYIPMTPLTAQYLANQLDCSLPTAKMVDIIYKQAAVQLAPQPIPPSDSMTTNPVFKEHTDSIRQQMLQMRLDRLAHPFMAGHKKDIIISNKIYPADRTLGRVVIYGWHLGEDRPIQPVYNGHHERYADYSHGTRLIAQRAFLNGDPVRVDTILKDRKLSVLLSNEGVIPRPVYPEYDIFTTTEKRD
ncbi:MAG: hypothetical protein ACFB15_04170 [Cyclobacteriaceae bacterium]